MKAPEDAGIWVTVVFTGLLLALYMGFWGGVLYLAWRLVKHWTL